MKESAKLQKGISTKYEIDQNGKYTGHECKEIFEQKKIDECSGLAHNRCYGIYPMILEAYFADKDGTECYFDNYLNILVNFCPYCGLKSES